MFKRILVPIDLEHLPLGRIGVAAASEIARLSNAALRLMNVVDAAVVTAPIMYMPAADYTRFAADQKKLLEDIARSIEPPLPGMDCHVRLGGVYAEVLAEADEWKADLIVIGAHRPSMATFLLGSSASAIVRHAKCSVLVVRQPPAAA